MDGRFFDTRRVEAYIADGTEKFRKSGEKRLGAEDEDEGKRLDQFGSWLESEGRKIDVEEEHNQGGEAASSAQAKNS